MATKGNVSEVGENKPTEKSNQDIENLVDDVLDTPALAPKSTLPKEEKGLENEEEEELQGEDQSESESTEDDEEGSESEEPSEDDEDVVPASKHKKILEKMQKRIDKLTSDREAAKLAKESSNNKNDDKLSALSISELQELRDNVDESIIDAKVTAKTDGVDMTARVTELKELKRSIDRTVKTLPQKLQSTQLKHLNDMADAVKEVDPEVVDHKGELWGIAATVYQSMPSLHNSETGQAEALQMAAKYYLEKKSMDNGREKASTLSKKVSSLKRKTMLDGKNRNANAQNVSSRKVKDKAIKGTYYDKLDFVKTLIPDEYLQP